MFGEVLIYGATFWAVVCFFDVIFKSCMLYPYLHMLEQGGLTVKPCQLQWYTTKWNRTIQKWGNWRPRFLRKWFALGTFISSVIVLPAFFLLVATVKNLFLISDSSDLKQQAMQPVMPGINLPLSDIPYYLITLMICSIFHELGHALAAVREDIKVQGCGFFIFGIFPGAFVDLPTEQVMFISPWRQLHVFCAGVWHNIILVLVAAGMLFLNPFLLSPLYQQGVSVISVLENSGAAGPAGLKGEEQILSINSCIVAGELSWKDCIIAATINQQPGYCIPPWFLSEANTLKNGNPNKFQVPFDCCDNMSKSDLCFEYEKSGNKKKYACLPVRRMLHEVSSMCNTSQDCLYKMWTCIKPVFDSNNTRLVQVHHSDGDLLFVGYPPELYSSVTVTRWVSRFAFFSARLAHMYETLLKYLVSFSAALVVLNVIPCPALDGQWIAQALVELLFKRLIPNQAYRKHLLSVLVTGGSLLIILTVSLGIWTLLKSG